MLDTHSTQAPQFSVDRQRGGLYAHRMTAAGRPQTTHPVPLQTHYQSHRNYVMTVLGRRCSWLDPSDREALWHDAFVVFLEKVRSGDLDASSMNERQVRAYLTETALHKAMDEGKRAERRRTEALDQDAWANLATHELSVEDRVARSFDRAALLDAIREMPGRRRHILALRLLFEYTPKQIQRELGVPARVYRREIEHGTRTLAERLEGIRKGTDCGEAPGAIIAYVTGIAGPTRSASIRRHLARCPACARTAAELRVDALHATASSGGMRPATTAFASLGSTDQLAAVA